MMNKFGLDVKLRYKIFLMVIIINESELSDIRLGCQMFLFFAEIINGQTYFRLGTVKLVWERYLFS